MINIAIRWGLFLLLCLIKVWYKQNKIGDLSRGWPEGSLFNSYYTEVAIRSAVLFEQQNPWWETPRSAVLAAARIWPDVSSRGFFSSNLGRPSLQPLTLFEGVRLTARRLMGMPTGLGVFLKMPGACGLRPCARTHLKKALCHTCPVVRRITLPLICTL